MKTVTLCAIAGAKKITGGNRLATGCVDLAKTDDIISNLVQKGFGHVPEPGALEVTEDTDIGREAYISMFGPTTGDRIRLGDTELWIEVEYDEVCIRLQLPFIVSLTDIRPCMETKSNSVEVCLIPLIKNCLGTTYKSRKVKLSGKVWVKLPIDPPPNLLTWSSRTL